MKQVNDTVEQNNSFRNRKPIDYYKYTREVEPGSPNLKGSAASSKLEIIVA